MKKRLVWLSAVCLLATTAAARDLEDILKDKGVLNPVEANEAKAAKEKEQATTEKALASIPPLPDWVKMVTLFGDVRIRNESFFQDGTKDRIRQRFRLRFGAKVKPTDEMEFGFKLASGTANDPISNNQTFGGDFTFKDISIANAYVKLTPYKSIGLDRPWLTVMGGKFDQPMYVPPSPNMLVWDKDLTPEGFFESLKVVDQKDGVLRGIALNLGQWIFQENSNTGEAAIYGFQGVGNLAINNCPEPGFFRNVLWNFGIADYYYVDPSSIAVDRNSNSSLNITNTVTLSDGEVVGGFPVDPTKAGPTKNGVTAPTVDPVTGETIPGKPITIVKLNEPFNDLNIGTDLMIPTGLNIRMLSALRPFGDFVTNTEANNNENGYQGGLQLGHVQGSGRLLLHLRVSVPGDRRRDFGILGQRLRS